ncbi:MAG: hypothetical protein QW794_06610 [Thermosphaera sp.]
MDEEKIIEIVKQSGLKERITEALLSDLSEPEYMAINALLMIAEDNKTQAERSYSDEVKDVVTSRIIKLPEEAFYRAFYEAYGLRKTRKGYDKKAKTVALEALRKLDEKKFLIPLHVVGKSGKKKMTITIIEHARLVEINREVEAIYEEGNKVKRMAYLVLKLHWVLTYNIDNFYALRRKDKNAIIAKLTSTRKEFYSVLRLTDFLETLDVNPVAFSEQRLAQIIGCKSLYEGRKKKRLREKIERTLEITKKAGWISEYRRDGDTYILSLNPELCCRVEKKTSSINPTLGYVRRNPGIRAQKPWDTCAAPFSEMRLNTVKSKGQKCPNKYITNNNNNHPREAPGAILTRSRSLLGKKGGRK